MRYGGRRNYCHSFVEKPELTSVPAFTPGKGQNIALYASPTAKNFFLFLISTFPVTRSGTLRTQKLRSPSAENPELTNVLPLKPGVGQNIAMHASPAATNFFLVLISTFTFIFFFFFFILLQILPLHFCPDRLDWA